MRGAVLRVAATLFALAGLVSCAGKIPMHTVPPVTQSLHFSKFPTESDIYSQTVLSDHPTAYYRLDDTGATAADSSGNGLNGAIGASVTTGVTGLLPVLPDTAIAVPGIASGAGTVLVPSSLQLQPAKAVSLETWLRFSASPAANTVPVAYGSDASFAPYDLFFRSGRVLVAQFDLNTGVLEITAPSPLLANTGYYVVSTFDGTTGRLYVNGSLVASAAKSGTLTNYQVQYGLAMGDDAGFSDPAFSGTLDEVAVYAGKALAAARVAAHYNAATNPNATPPPTPTPPPSKYDWSTMGFDLARSGYDSAEKTLGVAGAKTLHERWHAAIGGEVGEPALASNVDVGGKMTDVLYAAGAGGTFYALNAASGVVIWSHKLPKSTYYCGGKPFAFGANAAPVIDRATGRVYAGDGSAQVHAFDLATGAEEAGWPIAIASPADHNFIYAALTYNPTNRMLYAETSSTCDYSPWFGRIVAIDAANANVVNTFYPTQGTSGGGIWGFGGASVDAATNDAFIAVGNADTTHGAKQNAFYAEQVVELSPDVSTVIDHNYPNLPSGGDDFDFAATPLLFQPPGCPPLLAAMNKTGMFLIYNRGSIGAGAIQVIKMSIVTVNADFIGIPAYDPITNDVYVEQPSTFGIYRPGVAAFGMESTCTINPTPVWTAQFGSDGSKSQDDTLRSPITIADGVLYISDYITAKTFAFDAATGAQLWTRTLSGPGVTGPIVANGRLYVGSLGNYMTAWSP